MAGTLTPAQKQIQQQQQEALAAFAELRIALGQPVKKAEDYTFADIKATIDAADKIASTENYDPKNEIARLKSHYQGKSGAPTINEEYLEAVFHQGAAAARAVALLSPKAKPEFEKFIKAQQENMQATQDFIALRMGLGFKDQETYTQADIAATLQALREQKAAIPQGRGEVRALQFAEKLRVKITEASQGQVDIPAAEIVALVGRAENSLKLVGADLPAGSAAAAPVTPPPKAQPAGTVAVEMTQGQMQNASREFFALRVALGQGDVIGGKKYDYSPQAGAQTLTAAGTVKDDAKKIADMVATLQASADYKAFATPDKVKELLKHADANVNVLNQYHAAQRPAQTVEKRLVPAEPVPDDVRERVQRIEATLTTLAASNFGTENKLSKPGTVDGILDKDSFASFQATLIAFKNAVTLKDADGKPDTTAAYTPAIGAQLATELDTRLTVKIGVLQANQAKLIAEGVKNLFGSDQAKAEHEEKKAKNAAEIEELQKSQKQIKPLIADLDYLTQKGFLKPIEVKYEDVVVGAGGSSVKPVNSTTGTPGAAPVVPPPPPASAGEAPQVPPPSPPAASGAVADASKLIEGLLITLKPAAAKMGVGEGYNPPATADGEFGDDSRRSLSLVLGRIQKMAGLEADGIYSKDQREKLAATIMSNPDFAATLQANGIKQKEDLDVFFNALETLHDAKLLATSEQSAHNKAVTAVELGLYKYIQPMIGGGMGDGGILGKLGIGPAMPNLTAGDLKDTEADGKTLKFGESSQKMAAMAIMQLKEMAGINPPDGTYNDEIGEQLLNSIMTAEGMKPIRQKIFGSSKPFDEISIALILGKDDPADPLGGKTTGLTEAEIRAKASHETIMAQRQKAKDLQEFFNSMNYLQQQNKLLADEEAQKVTKANMFIDMAAGVLDKLPWLKKMIAGFLKSEWGQMIVGVAGAFGYDLNRLVGDKSATPQQVQDRSRPLVENSFKDQLEEARKKLKEANIEAPNFTQLMAKTEEIIKEKMNGTGFKAVTGLLFKGADEKLVQNAITAAVNEAKKADNEQDATKNFTNTLMQLGAEYRKKHNITIDPAEMDRTARDLQKQLGGPATPAPAPAPAPAASSTQTSEAGRRTTGNGVQLATAGQSPNADLGALHANGQAGSVGPLSPGAQHFHDTLVGMIQGGAGTTGGNTTSTAAPKDPRVIENKGELITLTFREPAPDHFKQGPVRLSNGRVEAMIKPIVDNFDKLGLTNVKKEDLIGKNGQPKDSMDKHVVMALAELTVRAQIDAGREGPITRYTAQTTNDVVDYLKKKIGYDPKASENFTPNKAGVLPEGEINRFQHAFNELHNDMFSVKGNPKKMAGSSVWDQSYFGALINVKVEPKPAPAAQTTTLPAPPPAKGPYDGIDVDPKLAALFERYKNLNGAKGQPHCMPMVFWGREEDGKIITREDDKKAGKEVEPGTYKAYVGLVDGLLDKTGAPDPNSKKTFQVLEITGPDMKNYAETRKLPDHIAQKMFDNYRWTGDDTIRGKLMTDSDPTVQGVRTNIKTFIDCALAPFPELMRDFKVMTVPKELAGPIVIPKRDPLPVDGARFELRPAQPIVVDRQTPDRVYGWETKGRPVPGAMIKPEPAGGHQSRGQADCFNNSSGVRPHRAIIDPIPKIQSKLNSLARGWDFLFGENKGDCGVGGKTPEPAPAPLALTVQPLPEIIRTDRPGG